MKRRQFLAGIGVGALALAGYRLWPDEGWRNPCLAAVLPAALADHGLVRAAWEGIDPAEFWDCHVHLVGVGDGDSGIWISPQMRSLLHPLQYLQRAFYRNSACAERDGQVDSDFLARLLALHEALRPGTKLMLLAFDHHYDDSGALDLEHSAYYAPNTYAREVAHRHPDRLEWIASIHPYRTDAVASLEQAARDGARAVKWLPSAMGIDPASPRCDAFYAALVRLGLPLLTHGGEEVALHGAAHQEFGNPLRLRRALEHGVRVIVAHCATIGSDIDLDRGPNGPRVPSFELFARLMDEARYVGRLYGELSAVTQRNRAGRPLAVLLERSDWHERLINGSDYPLPGVMPLFSLTRLVRLGLLPEAEAALLSAIRRHNPLLFDFVLKRRLRSAGRGFAPVVFHTRRLFRPA